MINLRKLFFFMALLTGFFALQGCDANEGPLEEAGEEIDDAVNKNRSAEGRTKSQKSSGKNSGRD